MTEETIDGIVGDGMTQEKKKTRKRKVHEVEKEHQDLYDTIVEEVFDPEWHRNTVQQHNEAYFSAVTELKGKHFTDRFEAEEALTDALIKYRTEAGLPVSKDPKHRHRIYGEVQQHLALMDQGKLYGEQLAGKVDSFIREGNAYKLLELLHEREMQENISEKVKYEVEKRLPHEKDPDFYQGILKAHGKYTGRYYNKGELAKFGHRDQLVERFSKLYSTEMTRMMEDYVDEQKSKKKTDEH